MIIKTYELDVVPGRQSPVVRLSQYDKNFRIIMELYAREGTFTIQSGTTATIRGTKPNNEAYEAPVSLSGNNATILGDGRLTDTAGTGVFELCLTHSGKELYTSNFTIEIEPSPAERGNEN